jgi:hypothetical protein
MFAASTILYKMLVCLSESRGGLHLENLFLATVDSAIGIAITRINYFYLIAHNSKETGEIFRISPRKSARGIRP